LGAKFIEASLFDVLFERCNLSYANFAEADFRYFEASESNLKESFFEETKFKNVFFAMSDLSKTEFFKTPLKDIDLSSDVIEGIHIDSFGLQGAIISPAQAILLASYFGLVIKNG